MLGKGLNSDNINENRSRGLQPRVLDHIFDELCEKRDEDPDLEFLVKASYFEIYNENLVDLVPHRLTIAEPKRRIPTGEGGPQKRSFSRWHYRRNNYKQF